MLIVLARERPRLPLQGLIPPSAGEMGTLARQSCHNGFSKAIVTEGFTDLLFATEKEANHPYKQEALVQHITDNVL